MFIDGVRNNESILTWSMIIVFAVHIYLILYSSGMSDLYYLRDEANDASSIYSSLDSGGIAV